MTYMAASHQKAHQAAEAPGTGVAVAEVSNHAPGPF
jgi:hypothetical protein